VAIARVPQPLNAILNEFGARYMMSDLLHRDFMREAERDPALVEVYRSSDTVVYEIVRGD
jgi:hypothetical protein